MRVSWFGRVWVPLVGVAVLTSLLPAVASAGGSAANTQAPQDTQVISQAGSISAFPNGSLNVASTASTAQGAAVSAARAVNRSLSPRPSALARVAASALAVPAVTPTAVTTRSGAAVTFSGINDYQQRFVASGGNQFTVTPPDQGLCVGNGFIVEVVNDTISVYKTSGAIQAGSPLGLNAFYGYPYEINRTTGALGPEPTDPNCYYDPQYGRWFVVVLTLEVTQTGLLTGVNHLDIAASTTPSPLGGWVFYHIPVQDDGTQGTPHHKSCPCIGDFPHIGADQFGFYITTNEYPFGTGPGKFGNNYNGAQVYAMSKLKLASNATKLRITHIGGRTLGTVPSFTLWPDEVPGTAYDTANGGTQWFVQSMATLETLNTTGMSNTIGVWSLTNTSSLDSVKPSISLQGVTLSSEVYGVPPTSEQKAGPVPLRDCLLTACLTGIGPSSGEVESGFDSSDSRILTDWLAGGKLYAALGTIVNVNGRYQAGVAHFEINTASTLTAVTIASQGYVAVAGNITYPSIAAVTNGAAITGAMAITLVGSSYFPSAAYMKIGSTGPTGSVVVSKGGAGPDDEFCGYLFYNCGGTTTPSIRPRWGDYGAAVVDVNNVWIASEFIGQACTINTFKLDPTCGATRAILGNWDTQISRIP
jgi:hypothetical protein